MAVTFFVISYFYNTYRIKSDMESGHFRTVETLDLNQNTLFVKSFVKTLWAATTMKLL